MRNETIISLALFVLLFALTFIGSYYVMFVTYLVGLFAIGYTIPKISSWIAHKLNLQTRTFK